MSVCVAVWHGICSSDNKSPLAKSALQINKSILAKSALQIIKALLAKSSISGILTKCNVGAVRNHQLVVDRKIAE